MNQWALLAYSSFPFRFNQLELEVMVHFWMAGNRLKKHLDVDQLINVRLSRAGHTTICALPPLKGACCVFISFFYCKPHYRKIYEGISMTFSKSVGHRTISNQEYFKHVPDHHLDTEIFPFFLVGVRVCRNTAEQYMKIFPWYYQDRYWLLMHVVTIGTPAPAISFWADKLYISRTCLL